MLALKPGTIGEGFKGASYMELVLRSSTQILGASLNQGAPLQAPHSHFPHPDPLQVTQAGQGPAPHSPPLLEQLLLVPSPAPRPRAPHTLNVTMREQPQLDGIWGDPDVKSGTSTHHGGVDLSQKPGVVLLNSFQALQHGRDVGVTEQEGSIWGENNAAQGSPSHPHSLTHQLLTCKSIFLLSSLTPTQLGNATS